MPKDFEDPPGENRRRLWYIRALAKTKKLSPSSEDISSFCVSSGGLRADNPMHFPFLIGAFISALINSSRHKEFHLYTSQFDDIEDLGCNLPKGKKVTIHGDGGDGIGRLMDGGKIIVNGNAGNAVGIDMEDGKIEIHGNAGDHVGMFMKGGSITIDGNAGRMLGGDIIGGKIVVKGDAGELVGGGDFEITRVRSRLGLIYVRGNIASVGGRERDEPNSQVKIYHRGRLVYDGPKVHQHIGIYKDIQTLSENEYWMAIYNKYAIRRK